MKIIPVKHLEECTQLQNIKHLTHKQKHYLSDHAYLLNKMASGVIWNSHLQ